MSKYGEAAEKYKKLREEKASEEYKNSIPGSVDDVVKFLASEEGMDALLLLGESEEKVEFGVTRDDHHTAAKYFLDGTGFKVWLRDTSMHLRGSVNVLPAKAQDAIAALLENQRMLPASVLPWLKMQLDIIAEAI